MANYSSQMSSEYEKLLSTTDIELLKRVWRNEKASPEILLFETSLVHRVKEQIALAEQNIDSFEENRMDSLVVSLYQMDLHRALFLFRSYLRARLHKIEKYSTSICTNKEMAGRLSLEEQEFAKNCYEAIGNHLTDAILSKMPPNYQDMLRQSITSEEEDMVEKPRLDTFVICKARKFLSDVDFEQQYTLEINEMEQDLLTFACYKFIKKPFEEGKIDLI